MKRLLLFAVLAVALVLIGCTSQTNPAPTNQATIIPSIQAATSTPGISATPHNIATKDDDISECKSTTINGSVKIEPNCVFQIAKAKGDSNLCDKIDLGAMGRGDVYGESYLVVDLLRNLCWKYFAVKNNDASLCDKMVIEYGGNSPFTEDRDERKDLCLLPIAVSTKNVSLCDKMPAKREDRIFQYRCYTELAKLLKEPDLCYKGPPYFNVTANIKICLTEANG